MISSEYISEHYDIDGIYCESRFVAYFATKDLLQRE